MIQFGYFLNGLKHHLTYSLTVKLAQTCLQKLKDGGVIPGIDLGAAGLDGKWGSNTQNSVQKFQLWYNNAYSGNLRTDGILDRQISDLLFAEEMKVPAIITPTINFNPDPPRKDEQTIITADCGEDVQSIKITVNNPQNNVQTFDNSGVCSVYSIQYTPTMEGNYTVTATVNNNDSSKATKTFLIAGTGGEATTYNIPLTLDQAVDNEYNANCNVKATDFSQPASKEEIRYYMDPNNFLNDPVKKYQFLVLENNSSLAITPENEAYLIRKTGSKGTVLLFPFS